MCKFKSTITTILLVAFTLAIFNSITPRLALASTPKIDEYISNVSVTKLSNGRFKVTYTVLKERASTWETIKIGYFYPAQYRISPTTQIIDYSVGTHTMYLSAPPTNVGWIVFKITYDAYSYHEEKNVKYHFVMPDNGDKTVYHTVTAAEAYGTIISYTIIPGILLELNLLGKSTKWVSKLYLGWVIYEGWNAARGTSFPPPIVGQYYRIREWYSSDGKVNTTYTVWNSKEAYDRGDLPIWSGTVSYSFPKP
jgi:hypothetical protein